jgi:enterochelin esterase-like enzyme
MSSIHSPRIERIARHMLSGKAHVINDLVTDVTRLGPIVEAHPRHKDFVLVTFVWKGDRRTKRVGMHGGLPAEYFPKPLTRLHKSHIWYRTEELPRDARISYGFYVNYSDAPIGESSDAWTTWVTANPCKPDALYEKPYLGASQFDLPKAPKRVWSVERPHVGRGTVHDHEIASHLQRCKRKFRVYTPSNYSSAEGLYNVLIMFDGGVVDSLIPLTTILDNLIAAKKIQPMVALMIEQGEQRDADLACNEKFTDSLVTEVIPWLRRHYRVTKRADQTVVCGQSLGGLAAAFAALRYPKVFGNVLSQSGSFWYYRRWSQATTTMFGEDTGWLTSQYAVTKLLPIKFYLDVGVLEQSIECNQVLENRRMRDVLVAKGYDITYVETSTGHDYLAWRETVADGLLALQGLAT